MAAPDLPEQIRSFVAIRLPPELLGPLERLHHQLRAALPEGVLRWTPIEQVHLTVKFLGRIEIRILGDLEAALREVCGACPPLELRLEALGCFPDFRTPRVVWLGVQGDLQPLEQLYHGVELATQRWSEAAVARAFRPHLTLGRVRDPRSGGNRLIGERIQGISLPPLGEWRVERLDLMRSELSANGAQHSLLFSVPLGGVAGTS